MSQVQENIESVKSYAIGIGSMTISQALHNASDLLQFLTLCGGFVIVVLRIRYDWRRNLKQEKDE
jgi:hypothetical protein